MVILWLMIQIQAAFRTDEIRRAPPTPQDEMRAGMSYFHETIWNGVPTFLRRVDTALKTIGLKERLPYNVPLIQFSSWMGGDRDGESLCILPLNELLMDLKTVGVDEFFDSVIIEKSIQFMVLELCF